MNVLIIDDHSIVRDGLALLIKQTMDVNGVLFASDGQEAIQQFLKYPVDLVLLDLSLTYPLEGLEVLRELRMVSSDVKIAIFSMHDEIEYQKQAFDLGADGYLIKKLHGDEIIQEIRNILAGRRVFNEAVFEGEGSEQYSLPLSSREKEVFIFTVLGYTQKEIANRLNIAIKTVEVHRRNIGQKLGFKKKSEWIELAKKYKIV
ncbi:response regulator [Neobacillus sp. LXY-4]|uniref:response regulator n=1 Tax=Neobacillus sp. LXY-4 TaxID=3379826 RepID=UPI003EE3BE0A